MNPPMLPRPMKPILLVPGVVDMKRASILLATFPFWALKITRIDILAHTTFTGGYHKLLTRDAKIVKTQLAPLGLGF